MSEVLHLSIGTERFAARLRRDRVPNSCARLMDLLPYAGKLIHARWSGEALWVPLAQAIPTGWEMPLEKPTGHPAPGEILLYAGCISEPELYIPYGPNHFACQSGALEGEPVLTIETRLARLAELGRETPWKGAMELRIEVSSP